MSSASSDIATFDSPRPLGIVPAQARVNHARTAMIE
jgi:hypothetical protein